MMLPLNIFLYPLMLFVQELQTIFPSTRNNACTKLSAYPFKYFNSKDCFFNPNVMRLAPDISRYYNYSFSTFPIVTSDGYKLTLFRIQTKSNKSQQPVFLQHGITVDGTSWMSSGNRSLAFKLADMGFDVWIGNYRGTQYSRGHLKYKDTDFVYWLFNPWHLACLDLAQALKTVGNETGRYGDIIYIGHSLGSSMGLIFAIENADDAKNLLRGLVLLSPAGYVDPALHMEVLMKHFQTITNILSHFKISAFPVRMHLVIHFLQGFCTILPFICRQLINVATGKTNHFLPEDMPALLSYCPSTLPMRVFLQAAQWYTSGEFQHFDYGEDGNMAIYGQKQPRKFDLGKVMLPTYLYYGANDVFISSESVTKTFNELGSCNKAMYKVPIDDNRDMDKYNHMDLLYADNIQEALYNHMFELIVDKLQPENKITEIDKCVNVGNLSSVDSRGTNAEETFM